jgi:hypothetical protein
MSGLLNRIAAIANRDLNFTPIALALGFGQVGEIDRFIFQVYGKAIRDVPPADRAKGAIFVLEPSTNPNALAKPAAFKPLFAEIAIKAQSEIRSIRLDLHGGAIVFYQSTADDRKQLVSGSWPQHLAQHLSRQEKKCVVWASGVGAAVYLDGDTYLQTADVVEEIPQSLPIDFQNLSWDDGEISIEFAKHKLNDTSDIGIWRLPSNYILRPKPETIMRNKFGEFLRYRLAGYQDHTEEAHVEHDGRADVSLLLVDGRYFIVEIKWIGRSLVAKRMAASEEDIKKADKGGAGGWFTTFDEKSISSGVKQLAIYYATGKYHKGYLAVFDCNKTSMTPVSSKITVDPNDCAGHDPARFCAIRAHVNPYSASRRAKTSR